MDLVNRLRRYIESSGFSVTQFADEAGITRPTLSQILSGRNKKISNEIISKLHEAFPDLDIMWLLFGEGDGEPHPKQQSLFSSVESPVDATESKNFSIPMTHDEPKSDSEAGSSNSKASISDDEIVEFANNFFPEQKSKINYPPTPIPASVSRRIVSITVFYDDCTYETLNNK